MIPLPLVSRTVVEATEGQPGDDCVEHSIENYEDCRAFVLLGESGAGKSTEFKRAAQKTANGHYVTARDFIALAARPEWRNKTLFIDALDERRAGSPDRRTPLDEIRSKLGQLGRPWFRISCRSVDWLGLNDQRHLSEVSPDGTLKILHLNPLADRDVMELLRRSNLMAAPQELVETAENHGLGELLRNPLTLQLLAKVVAKRDWPRTRAETYLRASRMLLTEHNEEHQLSTRLHFSDDQKLHAAGRLFAIKTLTGTEGYRGSPNGRESCTSISDAQVQDPRIADMVLHSGLFKRGESGQYIAFHEAIAEFLAGRFLASQANGGLPIGRILSLMTGYDGVILPQFRSVAAWMAAHSPRYRRQLASADPIGAILHGDVATFSVDDKIHVLESISTKSKDNPWFITNVQYDDPRFGRLASADMAEYYARNLGCPSRTDSHQVHAFFLLAVLKHGRPVSELSEVVLRVVEDGTWWPRVRIEALRVLLGLPPSDCHRQEILLRLLRRIDSGEVSDHDDELRGFLLRDLYPVVIGPDRILEHLQWPREPNLIGTYQAFWNGSIAKKSTASQLATLMDSLAERFAEVSRILGGGMIGESPFFNFIPSIAPRAILASGGDVGTRRLFGWLEIFTHPELRIPRNDQDLVRSWLAAQRDLLRGVFQCCVDHCLEQPDFGNCLSRMEHSLGLDTVSDYAQMCQSAAACIGSPEASLVLQERARNSRDAASSHAAQQPGALPPPAQLREAPAFLRHQYQHPFRGPRSPEPSADPSARPQYEEFKAHESALRKNRCHPATLFRLARIYFGEGPENPAGLPDMRLRVSLLDDRELIEAARLGLRNAVFRQDLPSVDEFARMFDKGQIHHLALPFLAGIEEIGLDGPVRFSPTGGVCKRLALTLHFGVPRMNPDPWRNDSAVVDCQSAPAWYTRLARDEPAVVTREFVRNARSQLRSGTSLLAHVTSLDSEPDRSTIAPTAIVDTLRMIPARAGTPQLESLAILLALARRHCAEKEFNAVVENKLRSRSMAVAQRVYWQTAAFLAAPQAHRAAVQDTVSTSQRRIRSMAEFLGQSVRDQSQTSLFGRLDAPDLELVIRMVGSCYGPDSYSSAVVNGQCVPWGPSIDHVMTELIERLSRCTSRAATEALERTRTDDSLKPWWFPLGRAADQQRAMRREAEFSYCSADAVCRVLDGREPANPADLAALTADALVELADNIRDGNTSDWKQYWIRDGNVDEWRPHHENDCRDALLSDLRSRLSNLCIDCQPEPNYLDRKRGDIRVAFSDYGVPIEIKKSDHRRVWSSIQSQLIPKYTQDPECDGCGIYVVLWLGRELLQPPLTGPKPSSPAEMRDLLVESLAEDQRRKVSVVVVDVSRTREHALLA